MKIKRTKNKVIFCGTDVEDKGEHYTLGRYEKEWDLHYTEPNKNLYVPLQKVAQSSSFTSQPNSIESVRKFSQKEREEFDHRYDKKYVEVYEFQGKIEVSEPIQELIDEFPAKLYIERAPDGNKFEGIILIPRPRECEASLQMGFEFPVGLKYVDVYMYQGSTELDEDVQKWINEFPGVLFIERACEGNRV
ncbi:MAG TPA: hypothetical protein ACFYD3_07230 [Candidatus Hypogeohydataceae bacterium YC41]